MPFFKVARVGRTDWDETRAVIVCAKNEIHARAAVVDSIGEDYPERAVFSSEKLVSVEEIEDTSDISSKIVLVDFKSG